MSRIALLEQDSLCYQYERDFSKDDEVTNILKDGVTSRAMLHASKAIKSKENSRLIKLPLSLNVETEALSIEGVDYSNINDLSFIADIACSSGSLKMVLECIEIAGVEDIMLKVQGPFSCLLSVVGSNTLFKWMGKSQEEVERALDKITDGLANYMKEAVKKGVNIISLADPSGMVKILGENNYKRFVAKYIIKLLKKIAPYLEHAIVHLCPLTSMPLEKYGFITTQTYYYDRSNYAQALIELAHYETIHFIGHRCINAENISNDKVYILSICDGLKFE